MNRVRVGFFLRQGQRRDNLEDALCVGPLVAVRETFGPMEIVLPVDEWLALAVLDGVGGRPAGEIASSLAAIRFASNTDAGTNDRELLGRISDEVTQISRSDIEYAGMCTTIAALRWSKSGWRASNAGDSSALALRDGQLVDLVAPDVDESGRLLRCLGRPSVIAPSVALGWNPQTLILATDGLQKVSDRSTMLKALMKPDSAIQCLWELTANAYDDVAVILVNLDETDSEFVTQPNHRRRKNFLHRRSRAGAPMSRKPRVSHWSVKK